MAQTLIEQLQIGAIDGNTSIGDLLRRAKLAAVKLKVVDFGAWVDAEMNGYWGQSKVPDYRLVSGELKFLNPTRGWCPIYGKGVESLKRGIAQPIGKLQALVASFQDQGYLTISVSESLAESLRNQVGFPCDIKMHVSPAAITGIYSVHVRTRKLRTSETPLRSWSTRKPVFGFSRGRSIVEAVRNNILEWTLKLETAGITGDGLTFTPEEAKAAQEVGSTHNYYGAIASVTHGVSSINAVSQTNSSATPQDIADAIAHLLQAIPTGSAASPSASEATSELAASETVFRSGRIPFGSFKRITSALETLSKAEDIALRAPEIVTRLHGLGQLLGLV